MTLALALAIASYVALLWAVLWVCWGEPRWNAWRIRRGDAAVLRRLQRRRDGGDDAE